jgi:ammonium transporter, Amt family
VKQILGYDDTLDVFGIHGIGGAVGAIAVGVFATAAVNPIFKDASGASLPVGLVDGNPEQLIKQFAGMLIAVVLSSTGTFVLLKIVDLLIGLRVSETDEITGLDATQHGEIAYIFEGSRSILNVPNATASKARGGVEDIIPTRIPVESEA